MNQKLSENEWNDLVRSFLKRLATSVTNRRGAAAKVAKTLDKSPTSIGDMKRHAKGSVVSWVRLITFKAGMKDMEVKHLLENPAAIFRAIQPIDELDEIFYAIKEQYNKQELAAYLKILRDKATVEEFLGVRVNATLLKKKTKSKKAKKKRTAKKS